jgi:hypothetical protein
MTDMRTLKEIVMLEGEGEEYPLGPTMIVNQVQANLTLTPKML